MEVSVDELLVLVNIALGNAPVSRCAPGDRDGSGDITIDEILSAVNRALNGCEEPAVALAPVRTRRDTEQFNSPACTYGSGPWA